MCGQPLPGGGRRDAGGAYFGRMRDRDLYSKILGVSAPWHVTDVLLDMPAGKVEVVVEHRGEACCPKCGRSCPGYDTRRRRWRHLDTCQFEAHPVARTP